MLDLDAIQGNITPGCRKDFQDFIFVRFPSPEAGRKWVAELYEEVSSARDVATFNRLRGDVRHPPDLPGEAGQPAPPKRQPRAVHDFLRSTCVNVAFSYQGLERLECSPPDLGLFPAEFAATPASRAEALSDNESDSFSDWEVGRDDGTEPHAFLLLGADTQRDLDDELARQMKRLTQHELLAGLVRYRGTTLGGAKEHFGFRDAISHPDPDNPLDGWERSDKIIAAGEFILGQPDEKDATTLAAPTWAHNGSYVVFRRLQQHVTTFWDTMSAQASVLATALGRQDGSIDQEFLAARLVGRWTSGAKLVISSGNGGPPSSPAVDPARDRPPTPDELEITRDDFAQDRLGDGCPLFSHVRKTHPRATPSVEPHRHRIIRRAIPYAVDEADRGLLFLAYQASIARQFEHIQRRWLNSSRFPPPILEDAALDPLGTPGLDPLVGVAPGMPRRANEVLYHRPAADAQRREDFVPLTLERFVTVTGSGYFFAPSIPALATLARLR